jgi:hypothetical protein
VESLMERIAQGLAVAGLMGMLCHHAQAEAPLVLASGGETAYAIYREPGAPPSVLRAAEEVQRVLRIATGAELPIGGEPHSPMIAVGASPAAREAGLSADALPDDGFLIATRGSNLYILGKDYPADEPPWVGWSSRGTLFGAYEFLEQVVGVRWLLPGEWGEDIPRHDRLVVPPTSIEESPDFPIRGLNDVRDRRPPQQTGPNEPKLWLLRQKIPSATEGRKLQHGHAWDDHVPPDLLEAHPEWLAADANGKRRQFARPALVKYCTSNPELVRAFAEGVIKWLEDHPTDRTVSISPSDGGDFCQCADCQALVTTDPHGNPSYTSLLLRFYNEVAAQVARKHRDRLLGAYVYYNYMYPPQTPVEVEPNLYLVWAPLNYYGFGLLRPVYRDELSTVVNQWLAVTPNFVLHNYSTWMRSFNGAPLPPGLDILKLELPTLHRAGAKGADMVGVGAWGYGGPTNYILAKQLWDAEVNVDDLFTEWLHRAYGPGWQEMRQVYMLIESGLKKRKESESPRYRGEMYEVNYEVIEQVYLPIFPEMERLYLSSLSRMTDEAQRRRLAMFGDNLMMLHYNMRKAGMLPESEESSFYRTDEQYQQFLADTEFSLALYRDHGKRYVGPIWKGEWSGE